MPQVPTGVDPTEMYVVARAALLDALQALDVQRSAVILVGAQAVYLCSQDAELAVSPFTADADLGLDPEYLVDLPRLEVSMRAAGFELREPRPGRPEPGLWCRPARVGDVDMDVEVDLLVPQAVAGGGGADARGARIPPHDRRAARKVEGLEAALVDNDLMDIASLQPDADARRIRLKVAGPAALLVAKAYKIRDRLSEDGQRRLTDKDAGDVVRLMMTNDVYEVADRFRRLLAHDVAGPVAANGLRLLHEQFAAARTPGTTMAVAALAGSRDARWVQDQCVGFMANLTVD